MAVLFIVFLILDRKDKTKIREEEKVEKKEEQKNRQVEREANNTILKELSKSNMNTANSLNLLRSSFEMNAEEFRKHDERTIKQYANLKEDLTIIKERTDK